MRRQTGLHCFPLLLMSTPFLIYTVSDLVIRSAVFQVFLVISGQFTPASTLLKCSFGFFKVRAMVPS